MNGILLVLVLLVATSGYVLADQKARRSVNGELHKLHSRPAYHGLYALLWGLITGWGLAITVGSMGSLWVDHTLDSQILAALPDSLKIERQLILSDAIALASGGVASTTDSLRQEISQRYANIHGLVLWISAIASIGGASLAAARAIALAGPEHRARNLSEKVIRAILMAMAGVAVLTTIGIVLSLVFETFSFFSKIGWRVDKYLFGTTWSPLSGVHDGVMDADKVGAVPLFLGTFLITLIALFVAVPVGLFAAIYLSDFAGPKTRAIVKPLLEILAGIPTVVYGFFAVITVAPFFRGSGEALGISIASESALVAGVVMGIMIIPFISSLSDDVINAVPQSLRDGSYGLGATKAETMRLVVLPAALPGVVSAVLLGMSRAIGETMIVVMAAGQGARLTANPFDAVTTVTVQIVMLITGDTEAETAAGPAFTLGFTLFCVTLLMNFFALRVVRRYRELYE